MFAALSRRVLIPAAAGLFLGTTACGESPANDLSRSEAWQASQAVASSSTAASTAAGASFITYSQAISGTVPCPDGGSITVDGEAMADSDATGTALTILASIEYSSCTYDTITLDGSLNQEIVFASSGSSAQATLNLNGALWFTGDIEGSCSIQMNLEASGTILPSTGASTASATLSGSFCGHDLAELQAEFTSNG